MRCSAFSRVESPLRVVALVVVVSAGSCGLNWRRTKYAPAPAAARTIIDASIMPTTFRFSFRFSNGYDDIYSPKD
ncbi:hypothetical protein D3C72_1870700 [compost metagenome]